LSSRRVKKGPGRRPQSAKRQLKELRERGWSILAAAREVGVSRTTGNNWSRGYKTYRRGQIVGFVSALERLAVRQISPRLLSQDKRIEIADLRHAGLSIRQIAHRLGRAPSTVSRELRRNATKNRGNRPFDAHPRATARRSRNHRRRLEANGELRRLVAELLIQRWTTADQLSLAVEVRQAVGDVAVSRGYLPGRLSAGIDTAAAISAGSAPSLTAVHWARSPARSSADRTPSGKV